MATIMCKLNHRLPHITMQIQIIDSAAKTGANHNLNAQYHQYPMQEGYRLDCSTNDITSEKNLYGESGDHSERDHLGYLIPSAPPTGMGYELEGQKI